MWENKDQPKDHDCQHPNDADKVKIMGAKVKVDSIMKVADFEEAEKMKMKKKVDKILQYKPDVFINR